MEAGDRDYARDSGNFDAEQHQKEMSALLNSIGLQVDELPTNAYLNLERNYAKFLNSITANLDLGVGTLPEKVAYR